VSSHAPKSSLRTFKEIMNASPEIWELDAAWGEISQGSDTAVALKDLFGYPAPLDSMNSKIRVAYALGIFGKATRDSLAEVTRIRNLFAHAPTLVNFNTPEILAACGKLGIIPIYKAIPHLGMTSLVEANDTARLQYMNASVAMLLALVVYMQEKMDGKELTSALLDNRSAEMKLVDMISTNSQPFLP
jgi:DNA-binding MltR family transcriptional regulator